MKLLALFAVLVTVACVSGAPGLVYDGPTYELRQIDEPEVNIEDEMPLGELTPLRHRRVTCDVLSASTLWFTANDSACAVRCLAQGRKGGRCENGVCICR
ncbi:defensin 2 [Xylocopa sonorina]|uniref:defensin 2 n=1 Tax=Xylocopa sonorina TaxID=1818115 RepID=UPI00403AA3E7